MIKALRPARNLGMKARKCKRTFWANKKVEKEPRDGNYGNQQSQNGEFLVYDIVPGSPLFVIYVGT